MHVLPGECVWIHCGDLRKSENDFILAVQKMGKRNGYASCFMFFFSPFTVEIAFFLRARFKKPPVDINYTLKAFS